MTGLKKLAAIFAKLGARDPAGWARSQLEEGIPQLARFVFLRQAWRAIVSEEDSSWIEEAVSRSNTHPKEPYAGVGHALRALRARGATDEEVTDLVRGMQARLLFDFCYLLEDPGDIELKSPILRGHSFRSMTQGPSLATSAVSTNPSWRRIPRGEKWARACRYFDGFCIGPNCTRV